MLLAVAIAAVQQAHAQLEVEYEGGITANAGTQSLAPYYIASNRGGTVTQQYDLLADAALSHSLDTTRRASWGFGAEVWAGAASSADYDRYNAKQDGFYPNAQHPARVWIQQLYAEVKYRGVFATLGAKQLHSPIVSQRLSSGDIVMSGNAKPGAGFNIGFVNFQNIPFTRGELQIVGQMGYYRLGDGGWLNHHYNGYNHFLTTGYWLNYKSCHFRTRPTRPLVLTIGAQAACQFAGTQRKYEKGRLVKTVKMEADAKAFFRSLIAGSGGSNPGDSYVEGNHLGSWDVVLEYKLPHRGTVRGYYQSPWEDGSSIGKQNGFDGLWGLEYRSGSQGMVSGVALEYLDFTNQCGPVHYSKDDHPNSVLKDHSTGADNYYNNYAYNGYQNRGMSIGTPFVKSPLYNRDGYLRYTDNLLRGFHAAVMGTVSDEVGYRAMLSYRRAWGALEFPRHKSVTATSLMLEATVTPHRVRNLTIKAQWACDWGSLYGHNAGGLVSISYHGHLNLLK